MHLERAYCVWSILWLYRATMTERSNVNLRSLHMKFSSIGPLASEEIFENVDGQTGERRWNHWYTISSPMSHLLK